MEKRAKKEGAGTAWASTVLSVYRSGLPPYMDILPNVQDICAPLLQQGIRAARSLASRTSPVLECLAVGIGLGILGAALVACAIPILSCIPSLPQ